MRIIEQIKHKHVIIGLLLFVAFGFSFFVALKSDKLNKAFTPATPQNTIIPTQAVAQIPTQISVSQQSEYELPQAEKVQLKYEIIFPDTWIKVQSDNATSEIIYRNHDPKKDISDTKNVQQIYDYIDDLSLVEVSIATKQKDEYSQNSIQFFENEMEYYKESKTRYQNAEIKCGPAALTLMPVEKKIGGHDVIISSSRPWCDYEGASKNKLTMRYNFFPNFDADQFVVISFRYRQDNAIASKSVKELESIIDTFKFKE